ncbi:MAG TPA: GyrI-like domain-containing protein [Bryobacteraceae bacterium]|nr:GyrI-like domain-containing protein [Bryobacteraceae bacterium]
MPEEIHEPVDELIERSVHVEIPAEVEDRLRRQLTEFRTLVAQRPVSRWRSLADSLIHPAPVRILPMTAVLLVALALGLVFIPRESRASQLFAAAAAQLRSSQSLQYTIVLNPEPYVAVDFSYLAPGYRRINCSWGIEVRTDGTTGNQIVLMHGAHTYLAESGKRVESQADIDDFSAQLRSMPLKADKVLGERRIAGKTLIGYRLHNAPPNGSIPGLQTLDVWIDPATREADRVDVTVREQGRPPYQMHIQNIRAGAAVDRALFDLAPPAGYTPMPVPGSQPGTGEPDASSPVPALHAQIAYGAPLTAAVLPMQGPYAQTRFALQAVGDHLKTLDVTPDGPPFGRYESDQHWEVGYPVPPGTRVTAPFRLISLPASWTASVVVNGAWGQDSASRWTAFLKSVVEQGYLPAGPAMEIWSGEDAQPSGQSTEMRIPVTKAK